MDNQRVEQPIGVLYCDSDHCEVIPQEIEEKLELTENYLDLEYLFNNLRKIASHPDSYLTFVQMSMDLVGSMNL